MFKRFQVRETPPRSNPHPASPTHNGPTTQASPTSVPPNVQPQNTPPAARTSAGTDARNLGRVEDRRTQAGAGDPETTFRTHLTELRTCRDPQRAYELIGSMRAEQRQLMKQMADLRRDGHMTGHEESLRLLHQFNQVASRSVGLTYTPAGGSATNLRESITHDTQMYRQWMGEQRDHLRQQIHPGAHGRRRLALADEQGLGMARSAARLGRDLNLPTQDRVSDAVEWHRRLEARTNQLRPEERASHRGELAADLEVVAREHPGEYREAAQASGSPNLRWDNLTAYRNDLEAIFPHNPQLAERFNEILADPALASHLDFETFRSDLARSEALQTRFAELAGQAPSASRQRALVELFQAYTHPDFRGNTGAELVRTTLLQGTSDRERVQFETALLSQVSGSGLGVESLIRQEGQSAAEGLFVRMSEDHATDYARNLMAARGFFEQASNAEASARATSVLGQVRPELRTVAHNRSITSFERADAAVANCEVNTMLLAQDLNEAASAVATEAMGADLATGPGGRSLDDPSEEANTRRLSFEAARARVTEQYRADLDLAHQNLGALDRPNNLEESRRNLDLETQFHTVGEGSLAMTEGSGALFQRAALQPFVDASRDRMVVHYGQSLERIAYPEGASRNAALSAFRDYLNSASTQEVSVLNPERLEEMGRTFFDASEVAAGRGDISRAATFLRENGFETLNPQLQRQMVAGMLLSQSGFSNAAAARFAEVEQNLSSQPAANAGQLLNLGLLYQRRGMLAQATHAFETLAALPQGNDAQLNQTRLLAGSFLSANRGEVSAAITSLEGNQDPHAQQLRETLIRQRDAVNGHRAVAALQMLAENMNAVDQQEGHGNANSPVAQLRQEWVRTIEGYLASGECATLRQAVDRTNAQARFSQFLSFGSRPQVGRAFNRFVDAVQPGMSERQVSEALLGFAREAGVSANTSPTFDSAIDSYIPFSRALAVSLRQDSVLGAQASALDQRLATRANTLEIDRLLPQLGLAMINPAAVAGGRVYGATSDRNMAYEAGSSLILAGASRSADGVVRMFQASRVAQNLASSPNVLRFAGSVLHGTTLAAVDVEGQHLLGQGLDRVSHQGAREFQVLPDHYGVEMLRMLPLTIGGAFSGVTTGAIRRNLVHREALTMGREFALQAASYAVPTLVTAGMNLTQGQSFSEAFGGAVIADLEFRRRQSVAPVSAGSAQRVESGYDHLIENAPQPAEPVRSLSQIAREQAVRARERVSNAGRRVAQGASDAWQAIPDPVRAGMVGAAGVAALPLLTAASGGSPGDMLVTAAMVGGVMGGVRAARGPMQARSTDPSRGATSTPTPSGTPYRGAGAALPPPRNVAVSDVPHTSDHLRIQSRSIGAFNPILSGQARERWIGPNTVELTSDYEMKVWRADPTGQTVALTIPANQAYQPQHGDVLRVENVREEPQDRECFLIHLPGQGEAQHPALRAAAVQPSIVASSPEPGLITRGIRTIGAATRSLRGGPELVERGTPRDIEIKNQLYVNAPITLSALGEGESVVIDGVTFVRDRAGAIRFASPTDILLVRQNMNGDSVVTNIPSGAGYGVPLSEGDALIINGQARRLDLAQAPAAPAAPAVTHPAPAQPASPPPLGPAVAPVGRPFEGAPTQMRPETHMSRIPVNNTVRALEGLVSVNAENNLVWSPPAGNEQTLVAILSTDPQGRPVAPGETLQPGVTYRLNDGPELRTGEYFRVRTPDEGTQGGYEINRSERPIHPAEREQEAERAAQLADQRWRETHPESVPEPAPPVTPSRLGRTLLGGVRLGSASARGVLDVNGQEVARVNSEGRMVAAQHNTQDQQRLFVYNANRGEWTAIASDQRVARSGEVYLVIPQSEVDPHTGQPVTGATQSVRMQVGENNQLRPMQASEEVLSNRDLQALFSRGASVNEVYEGEQRRSGVYELRMTDPENPQLTRVTLVGADVFNAYEVHGRYNRNPFEAAYPGAPVATRDANTGRTVYPLEPVIPNRNYLINFSQTSIRPRR